MVKIVIRAAVADDGDGQGLMMSDDPSRNEEYASGGTSLGMVVAAVLTAITGLNFTRYPYLFGADLRQL